MLLIPLQRRCVLCKEYGGPEGTLSLGVLVGSHEEDVLGEVVVDDEEEGVVALELLRSYGSGDPQGDEGGGCCGFCAFLRYLDEGLVDTAADAEVGVVREARQVSGAGGEEVADAHARQGLQRGEGYCYLNEECVLYHLKGGISSSISALESSLPRLKTFFLILFFRHHNDLRHYPEK